MEMTFEPIWDSIIAWYLFLAGLGGGAFATSAFLHWRHPHAVTMRKIGHLIAPIAVAVGLVLLMFDAKGGLFHPWRFALLLHNPFSVMTWGRGVPGVLHGRFDHRARHGHPEKVRPALARDCGRGLRRVRCHVHRRAFGRVQDVPAVEQPRFCPSCSWCRPRLRAAASVLLTAIFKHPEEFKPRRRAQEVPLLLAYHRARACGGAALHHGVQLHGGLFLRLELVAGQWAPLFWIGLVAVGLVLPTVLECWLLFFSPKEFEESRKAHYISAASDAAVLIGGFLLRFLIVMAALPVTIS